MHPMKPTKSRHADRAGPRTRLFDMPATGCAGAAASAFPAVAGFSGMVFQATVSILSRTGYPMMAPACPEKARRKLFVQHNP